MTRLWCHLFTVNLSFLVFGSLGVKSLNVYTVQLKQQQGDTGWSLLPLDVILNCPFSVRSDEPRTRKKMTWLSDHKLSQLVEQLKIFFFSLYELAFRKLWEGVNTKTCSMVGFPFLFITARRTDRMAFEEKCVKESNMQIGFVEGTFNHFQINYMTEILRKTISEKQSLLLQLLVYMFRVTKDVFEVGHASAHY